MKKPLSHLVSFVVLLALGACTPLGNFDFSFGPAMRDVKQGEAFVVAITIQRTGEYNSPITLSVVPPSGIKISAPDQIVQPDAAGGTLNIFVDPSVAPTQELKLTLKAVGDRRQRTKTLTLKVLEANFEPVLESVEAQQGQVFFLSVGLRRIGSFDQPVKVSMLEGSSGISANEVTIGVGETRASLMVTVGPNAPLGDQVVKLKYVGGSREKIADYTLKVIESEF